MIEEKQYYALGFEVDGHLTFLSKVEQGEERPNVVFTDEESEILIFTNLEEVKRAAKVISKRVNVEVIKLNFEEEEAK